MTVKSGLKSWNVKTVRAFLVCYNCGKRRCIYSAKDAQYDIAKTALLQKLESVYGRFSCGDLLFAADHHLSTILVQKQNMTCESRIENAYYNHKERRLKLKNICIHCGESGSSGSFILTTPELRERNLTDGYDCFPICIPCLGINEKVVKAGRTKNLVQARKESIAKADAKKSEKTAKAAANKSKK